MKIYRDTLAGLVLIWQGVYIHNVWHLLPAMLPSHFGLDGAPNRYAPRSFLWLLFGVSIGIALFLSIIERFPHAFNLPRPVGDPDRPRLEALAINLLSWLRLEIICTFAYTLWSSINVSLQRSAGLGTGFTFVCLGVVILTVAFFLWRMKVPRTSQRVAD